MTIYKHILITSDLTKSSLTVCHKTKLLCEAIGAKLSIVHIVEPPPLLYGGGEFVIPLDIDMESSLAEEAKSSLIKQSELLNIPKNEQWVVIGNIREEVLKITKEHAIDLIVVGGHDRHGLGLLLSSTTDAFVHALPCDIWIIKVDPVKE